ncbi:MAG: hypothetical protein ACRD1X_18805, partial [Vicinamibacteria bacterium]
MNPKRTIQPRLPVLVLLILAMGNSACRNQEIAGEAAMDEGHEHGGGAAVTIWTEAVELFFEH